MVPSKITYYFFLTYDEFLNFLINWVDNKRCGVRRVTDTKAELWCLLLRHINSFRAVGSGARLHSRVAGHCVTSCHTVVRLFIPVYIRLGHFMCSRSRGLSEVLVECPSDSFWPHCEAWRLTFACTDGLGHHRI